MKAISFRLSVFVITFLLVSVISFPASQSNLSVAATYPLPLAKTITLDDFLAGARIDDFLSNVSYQPEQAKYFDLIDKTFALNGPEKDYLERNGFVVTERLAYQDFIHAYAWMYSKDLPVIITTDAMLQAVHETFSDLLSHTEVQILSPRLETLLSRTRDQLRADKENAGAAGSVFDDLDVYLSVALAVLKQEQGSDNPAAGKYLNMMYTASDVEQVSLFGGRERLIDFTRFQPSGHYLHSPGLQAYFRAMMWLSQIDFRLLDYDEYGRPILNLQHLAAAALLHNLMEESGTRAVWDEMDGLFQAFFGVSDNTTLPDMDQIIADTGITAPQDALNAEADALLNQLQAKDYGVQRITGQIIPVAADYTDPIPRPISFFLLGQRFAIDSYLMSGLVYDRLIVDGKKVERPFPKPLDVMYVLGNDQAAAHLQDELSRYGYQGNLAALRESVDSYESDVWSANLYNHWLTLLQRLNDHTTGDQYPQAMRTEAWADKALHTELASWAQLRHDTILYTKQSYTAMVMCEYPAGYVEPYPDFYAALADYARAGRAVFEKVTSIAPEEQAFKDKALTYFDHLEKVSNQLKTMAEKELRLEEFSPEEENFLKSLVILQSTQAMCGLHREEWNGWYAQLFPFYAEKNLIDSNEYNPFVIADVHTNVNNLIPPQGVLHVGTGSVATQLFIVDTDEGQAIYAGPAFTYYEFVEPGYPPNRLNDLDWAGQFYSNYPSPPEWVASFRIAINHYPDYLIPGLN